MKKQLWLGLCATLLLVTAQPIFAGVSSDNACVFRDGWQPKSYKNNQLIWITSDTRNGEYKVLQQTMGCDGYVCTLRHVLGESRVSVCVPGVQNASGGMGVSCHLYPGRNWDLHLARSFCSDAYQQASGTSADTNTRGSGDLYDVG